MRTRYNSVIQHVIAQSAVAIFGPPQAVAALAHELCARFLAQGNNRRGIELLPHNCEASSLPKEPTDHPNQITDGSTQLFKEFKTLLLAAA